MAYDVTIVGLGGMGSAILSHCARRGAAVAGLEQFAPAHDLGSSHGKSRMIRKAYFEDPAYVPLLLRAYDLWRELEDRTGQELLKITGLLMVGHEAAEIITGAQRAAREHNLPLESLSTRELRARYPMLRVQDDEIGAFEPEGGVLDPERCVQAHLDEAGKAGAQIRFGIAMESWEATDDGFVVRLADGDCIESRALVLSLGPWFQEALGKLGVAIRVQRNVQTWFEPATDVYNAGRFPAFLLDRIGLPAPLYGFPDFGDGVKAAFHAHGDLSRVVEMMRGVDPHRDVEPVRRIMEAWMPVATATFRAAKVCPYSLTPDGHFVVDRHPEHPGLVLCGGFSGHGFKFAPVIGEIAADITLAGTTRQEIGFLSLRRFENASSLE
ncbi:MAG: N-methyl-L-tryptophan oxidase [Chthoniobacterales bacterium]|nr:N-methyl-L-tryptophan oxidase [Chthoniobacterales bacterium]